MQTSDFDHRAGARLRSHRLDRGLTQRQVAAATGLTPQTLVRIEQGRPSRPATRMHLASFYGVRPSEIWTGGADIPTPKEQTA